MYFTLVQRYEDGIWGPECGSYTRQDMVDEVEEYRDRGLRARIICTHDDSQASIDARIRDLNEGGA